MEQTFYSMKTYTTNKLYEVYIKDPISNTWITDTKKYVLTHIESNVMHYNLHLEDIEDSNNKLIMSSNNKDISIVQVQQ